MTSEGQRRAGRVFRGTVLLVPLLLATWWLWQRPVRVASPFDDALDTAVAPVLQQSEVLRKLGAVTSTQARVLARGLAQRSVPYLAARDLELWAATRARVAKSSKSACARLWKGGDEAFMGPAIASLGPDELEAYTQMLARALALRLERKPPPASSPAALERGFASVAAQLPVDQRASFEADMKRRDVDDERACQLFLTLAGGAEKLEPALRVDFYRALAGALEVPP